MSHPKSNGRKRSCFGPFHCPPSTENTVFRTTEKIVPSGHWSRQLRYTREWEVADTPLPPRAWRALFEILGPPTHVKLVGSHYGVCPRIAIQLIVALMIPVLGPSSLRAPLITSSLTYNGSAFTLNSSCVKICPQATMLFHTLVPLLQCMVFVESL